MDSPKITRVNKLLLYATIGIDVPKIILSKRSQRKGLGI